MNVAEAAGGDRDVLSPHVDVPVNLTLLAGEASTCHGGHVRGGTFPYESGEDETLGGPRARVRNSMDCFKFLLFEGCRHNRPENTSTDVSEEGMTLHMLCAELQVGLGT